MAKRIDTIAINIDAQQPIEKLDSLRAVIDSLKKSIKETRGERDKALAEGNMELFGTLTKQLDDLGAHYKDLYRVLKDAVTEVRNLDDIMANLSGAKYNELTKARTAISQRIKRSSPDEVGYAEELEALQQVNREIEKRNKLFKDMSEEERESLKVTREAIVAHTERFSVAEIQNAIKFTKELRDLEKIDSDEYKRYQQEADALQEVLDLNKKLAEEQAKRDAEARRVDTIINRGTASVDQLKEAIKLTEQLRDAESRGNYNYEYYKSEVEELQKALDATKELSQAEQQRLEQLRQFVVNDPTKASVEQLKEAIKLTEKLRDTKPIESSDYKQYNDELTKLKDTLKSAEQPIKNIALSGAEMRKVLKNLDEQPLEKLEQVASQLEEELSKLAPNTRDFIRVSNNLKFVNGQIDEMKESWKEHDGQILATIKRLSAYVAVYGSYNFIAGKIKDMVSGWLQLSDTLADVQKTTGLAHKQLALLSKDIDAIDTRTTQEGMHQLAAVAGQIGLRSREDILGFVRASDQLTVALNELGDDGVQSLAKLATLTGDVRSMGIEKSMLAIGSSINELSASSSAAAGPIADFMRRVGGMANMANLSTADLAALGATADALGQPIEVAATAMNKFITTLVTKTDDVAYALNMDKEALKELIDSGDTVKAITQVLDAVRAKGDEGALAGIFKELGSEGARMQQVMMAMAENTRLLRQQITTSRDAFAEATSATEEYNVKNETAAAIVERIGNTVREFFVTAEGAQWLTKPLNGLLDIVKVLTGVSDAAAKARGAFAAFFVLFSTKKFFTSIILSLRSISTEVKRQTVGVVGLRKVWIALKTAMSATNVISLAMAAVSAAIVGVVTAMSGMRKQAKMTAEALEDLREQEQGEKKNLDELYSSMTDANITQERRKELIQAFNDKYSDYLGYVLDEKSDIEDLTRAYELLNAQIELRYAKMLSTEYMKGPLEEYGRSVRKINEELKVGFETLSDRMGIHQKTLIDAVSEVAKKYAEEGKELGVTNSVFFARALGEVKGLEGANAQDLQDLVNNNIGNIKRLIQAEKDLLAARAEAEEEEKILVKTAEDNLAKARQTSMNGLKEEVEGYAKNTEAIKEMKDEEVQAIIDKGNTVLEYLKEQNSTEAEAFSAQLDVVRKIYAGDAWGKALNIQSLKEAFGNLQNLGTASVDNLVQTYKTLEDAGKRYTNTAEFNSIFGMNAQTIDEMHTFFKNYASQVKDRIKELGYTTAGNFDWSGEKGKGEKEKIKKEFEAAKSALLAYYEERETIIKQAYLDEEITSEEMSRRIAANEQEKSRALVDFYSVMLGEAKKYGIEIEEILEGKDLQKLAQFLTKLGPAMVDGMRLGREQSEGAIRDEAIKMREIIEKALLEGDMFGKLEDDFRSMLDELSLLTKKFGTEFIAVDDNTAKKLVTQLTGMADKAYTMTREELKTEGKKSTDPELVEWWSGVSDEQLTLLLDKLQNYYDERLEMQRKYAQKMQREWQQYYKQTGGEAAYDANKQMIEGAEDEPEGYVKGAGDYNRQRGLIKAKAMLEGSKMEDEIASYQERLKTLTEGSAEYETLQGLIAQRTVELNNIIQQSEIDTTNVTLEQWQKRAEALSGWAEMVGETMGEVYMLERQANNARARGDEETAKKLEAQAKESRQNLVKEALNKAIDMAKVWAMELGFKVMYNALAKKSDEDVAASGAKASLKSALADIIAQGFKGAGKEVGSKGMAGLITGAVIIAAAAGLAALAKSAVANMYPEATEGVSDASTNPKRKLTTGMLTYAEGKYPVLGNDGVVYDAEYAGSNMKTGVYRKPHFGIFAEKQPEMVIDGKTTQRLVLNYPEIYSGILELSRTGRMGMRTYATGNVLEIGEGYDAQAHQAQQQMQMEEMRMTMAATAAAVAALTRRLDQPIHAEMNYFGKGGAREAEQRGSRWATRNRVK